MAKQPLENFNDEELRAELQRRVDLMAPSSPQPTDEATDLSELPPGAWGQQPATAPTGDRTLADEYQGIMRLGLARIRELLAIPIDPGDPNYAATLRGINSAVSTVLTFISKANDELVRPPKQDRLPEILRIIQQEEEKIRARRGSELPELVHKLIAVDDDQLQEALAKRQEHLKWREQEFGGLRQDARNTPKGM
jgi:hypothetical protein